MAEQTQQQTNEESTPVYEGHVIPRWLLLVWLGFFVWGGFYIVKNVIPSLKQWLTNPPVQ